MTSIHAKHWLPAGTAIALLAFGATPACAAEGGLGPYPKGFVGFMSGYVPPEEGLYVSDNYYYFHGSVGADVRHGITEFDVDATLNADFLEAVYVTDAKILGGTYAFSAAAAYAWVGLNASLNTPIGGKSVSLNQEGFGDSIVAPAVIAWHDGNFHWSVALSVYVPTGGYSSSELSIGKNYWAFMPSYSLTYFDPKTGWDVSGSFVYETMTKNDATDYQTGDTMNLDWAIGKHFGAAEEWEAGIVGNVVQQIGADRGNGAKLGPLKAEGIGIGPGINYGTKFGNTPVNFSAKWEHDIDAHDTFEGDVVSASVTVAF
jgi:hypothetical protein